MSCWRRPVYTVQSQQTWRTRSTKLCNTITLGLCSTAMTSCHFLGQRSDDRRAEKYANFLSPTRGDWRRSRAEATAAVTGDPSRPPFRRQRGGAHMCTALHWRLRTGVGRHGGTCNRCAAIRATVAHFVAAGTLDSSETSVTTWRVATSTHRRIRRRHQLAPAPPARSAVPLSPARSARKLCAVIVSRLTAAAARWR